MHATPCLTSVLLATIVGARVSGTPSMISSAVFVVLQNRPFNNHANPVVINSANSGPAEAKNKRGAEQAGTLSDMGCATRGALHVWQRR